jgi:hypothetical protein
MAVREIVLDPETGLPEIRATRAEDGTLRYRVHTVHPGGGMAVFQEVTEPTFRLMREKFGQVADGMADRLRQMQLALAASYQDAAEAEAVRFAELQQDHAALMQVAEADRQRADAAELRVAELERDRDAQGEAQRDPRTARTASPAGSKTPGRRKAA